jgi:hypothetical protein
MLRNRFSNSGFGFNSTASLSEISTVIPYGGLTAISNEQSEYKARKEFHQIGMKVKKGRRSRLDNDCGSQTNEIGERA